MGLERGGLDRPLIGRVRAAQDVGFTLGHIDTGARAALQLADLLREFQAGVEQFDRLLVEGIDVGADFGEFLLHWVWAAVERDGQHKAWRALARVINSASTAGVTACFGSSPRPWLGLT